MPGMSGSPLLARDENGEFFVIGVHWGRIPKETKKTGGCLFNQKVSRQIEAWLDQAKEIPLKARETTVAIVAINAFAWADEVRKISESEKTSASHLHITDT